MILDQQASISFDNAMIIADWLFTADPAQGVGPGPVTRPVVPIAGSIDIPIVMAGNTNDLNLQPHPFFLSPEG